MTGEFATHPGFASKILATPRTLIVYLPPGYFTSSARYPVLYLVHGAGDTALGWSTAGAANLILDSLIGARTAVPMPVRTIVMFRRYPTTCAAS